MSKLAGIIVLREGVDNMVDEVWKPVNGYEGLYEVSNQGNVRSLKRATTSGKILKQHINKLNGYCTVSLSKNNVKKTRRVHKLVMMAFDFKDVGYKYDKEHTINHINGDKTDNRLCNLEWCSQSENQIHAYNIGINGKTTKRVIDLDNMQIYESLKEAANSVGGKKGAPIVRVCKGERSQYRNHRFAYYDDYINGNVPKFKGIRKKESCVKLWR